jgi:Family of unknown function (DUF6455)
MSDFCLHPDDMACINRQGRLMDRMMLRAGVSAGEIKAADPWRWHEARLRCLTCGTSDKCLRWLDGEAASRERPAFCPNLRLFEQYRKG